MDLFRMQNKAARMLRENGFPEDASIVLCNVDIEDPPWTEWGLKCYSFAVRNIAEDMAERGHFRIQGQCASLSAFAKEIALSMESKT